MDKRTTLSETPTALKWIGKFPYPVQQSMAELLDSLLLMDDAEVSKSILSQIANLAGGNDRIALYAEREIATQEIFPSSQVKDKSGIIHRRAIGRRGPRPVEPTRGSSRVGSEGYIAFLISQAVKSDRSRYLNHPGPDRFRKAGKSGVHHVAIVTDFIGSGSRIYKQLNAFWRVPSVAAWKSMGLINFHIVAAVTTLSGKEHIESHKLKPTVCAARVAHTLSSHQPRTKAQEWIALCTTFGPKSEPLGFGNMGALVAFRYGLPNNAPKILWDRESAFPPPFPGPAPEDAYAAFDSEVGGQFRLKRVLGGFTQWIRTTISELLPSSPERAKKLLFLSALGGKWRQGREIEIARKIGVTVPEVLRMRRDFFDHGWIGSDGRVTDSGKKLLASTRKNRWVRAVVTTNPEPYYPRRLRAP